MYEKDGEKYFVVDSHSHFWDASRENWKPGREEFAKGWIDCFYGYHQLGPPETHWDYERYLKVSAEDFERDMFIEGHVDHVVFQSTYLYDWYTEGFNTAEGQRLFNEDGTDTELLTNAVGFLGEFQQNIERTRWFMQQLVKHDLLEPRNVQLHKGDPEAGNAITLNGLYMVNEDKLRALDEKVAHELMHEGVLGWVYAHLLSLANIDRLARRLSVREQAEPAADASRN